MNHSSITIESILAPGLTLTGFPGTSKKKVIEHISQTIAREHPKLDADHVFESLIAREKLGSTGVGQGIAIPHARLNNCSHVIGSLVRLKEKIDFDAIDGKPVDLLFVLVVPKEATSEHLELLSQIAEKFNNPKLCDALRQAENDENLYSLMFDS
jgi:PTS system nitrogen regulatory IIA component